MGYTNFYELWYYAIRSARRRGFALAEGDAAKGRPVFGIEIYSTFTISAFTAF